MQNSYAGDVGDFGKFGLLRRLSKAGLQIGVNWYLVPDEKNKGDGRLTGYLSDNRFAGCDDELLSKLREIIIKKSRSVASLESAGVLADAVFYHKKLDVHKAQVVSVRSEWHTEALDMLKNRQVVFLDPDNGLLAKSISPESVRSSKYVFLDELADYYRRGQSIVFYNHRPRQRQESYLARFRQLKPLFPNSSWMGVKFMRGTVRDYFFIMQQSHAPALESAVASLLDSNWSRHFKRLEL